MSSKLTPFRPYDYIAIYTSRCKIQDFDLCLYFYLYNDVLPDMILLKEEKDPTGSDHQNKPTIWMAAILKLLSALRCHWQ